MAGDWIKMRDNLWDDPRVSRLCDMTGSTEATAIGGLFWLWATCDQHTENGRLEGVTTATIDRKTRIKGFGKALISVGWLEESEDGLSIPRFDEHNGASAKRRAMETRRKEASRIGTKAERMSAWKADKMRTGCGQVSASDADDLRAREEKRREILETSPQEGRGEILSARATRLPPHWSPSQTLTEWAKSERPDIQGDDLLRATQDFRDHYRSTGAKREDWDAAWQKWVRGQRAKQSAHAIDQGPAAASHSVERAQAVIEETRAAAKTAVPMPEAIRALVKRTTIPQDPEQVP